MTASPTSRRPVWTQCSVEHSWQHDDCWRWQCADVILIDWLAQLHCNRPL